MPDNPIEVPVGEWFDVPTGLTAVPDTYHDARGVLRSSANHAIAVWHNGSKGKPPCDYRVIDEAQIRYADNGAPWCPKCWGDNEKKAAVAKIFGPTKDVAKVVDPTNKNFKDF